MSQASWSGFGRSLLATLALGLALGCALASSVAAQEGNIATAIILAVLSLLLAAVISVTVVPRLALRVGRDWPRLTFSISKEGWFCVLSLAVVALAALNTGNNLIFVIFSAALAALVVSQFLSSFNLAQLTLKARLPEVVNAGEQFLVVFNVRNSKTWIPSFSIQLEGHDSKASTASAGPDGRCIFTQHPQAHFFFLPAGGESQLRVGMRLDRRGQYSQPEIQISSRFPFGFVRRTRRLPINQDLLVLPGMESPGEFLECLPLLNGALVSRYRGLGTDLYSIRDYSPGDNARFLDWKATAKTAKLQFREFTREDDRQCCFVFDNIFSDFQESDRIGFERAVTLCASAARHFHEMGIEIRLVTPEASTTFSKSPDGLLAILKMLALIEPVLANPYSFWDLSGEIVFKVIFTPRRRRTIPTPVWNSSQVFYISELQPR
jgi:uncharacterized protein (DUF58 family)